MVPRSSFRPWVGASRRSAPCRDGRLAPVLGGVDPSRASLGVTAAVRPGLGVALRRKRRSGEPVAVGIGRVSTGRRRFCSCRDGITAVVPRCPGPHGVLDPLPGWKCGARKASSQDLPPYPQAKGHPDFCDPRHPEDFPRTKPYGNSPRPPAVVSPAVVVTGRLQGVGLESCRVGEDPIAASPLPGLGTARRPSWGS